MSEIKPAFTMILSRHPDPYGLMTDDEIKRETWECYFSGKFRKWLGIRQQRMAERGLSGNPFGTDQRAEDCLEYARRDDDDHLDLA